MTNLLVRRLWATAAGLVLPLLGAGTLMAAGPSDAAATKTLDRDLEPVVVTGTVLAPLADTPVDEIFVYAYSGTEWVQIPAQVDEVSAGSFVATEDGKLDEDDEIVFMAKDTGDEAPVGTELSSQIPVSITWFEVEVTDPLSPTNKGWAYVVRSSELTKTNTTDYVNFNNTNSRVIGQSYTLGFATPDPWADYLTLGSSDVDILDRTKVRLLCASPDACLASEETGNISISNDLVKDGNVRIIIRNGRVLGYGSMLSWSTPLTIPPLLQGNARVSVDFSPAATGATLYTSAVSAGSTVDGTPDTVSASPVSSWFQLSTGDGTVLQVADIDQLGGTPSNYYRDDSTIDPGDTGDDMRYGEVGTYIVNPASSFTYAFNLYALEGTQPNVGARYQTFFEQPLTKAVTRFDDPEDTGQFLFIPEILRAQVQ